MKSVLLVSFLLTTPAKMPSPETLLRALTESDPPAALRFCAERPALHAGKGAEGHDSWVNLFARLRPDGAEAFLAASKRARREGPFTLRIEPGSL